MHDTHGSSLALGDGHGGGHGEEAGHGSVQSYLIGFGLSVILTAIPFGLVMSGAVPASSAIPICIGFAVTQIGVHLVYFLHMNTSPSQTWNLAAFVFTLIILVILVAGSLWVMYHLDTNMMPGMMPTH
jgi:cytochrome o ubiquinol oxidase subunit IV